MVAYNHSQDKLMPTPELDTCEASTADPIPYRGNAQTATSRKMSVSVNGDGDFSHTKQHILGCLANPTHYISRGAGRFLEVGRP